MTADATTNTSEHLLTQFDRMCEAPDAVPTLRRFVLDLAVRGKLVEQDSHEGPASELMKSIEAERAQLLKAGEIRKSDSFDPIGNAELPFDIPVGWQVARMGWLAKKLGAGSTPLGGKSVYQSKGVPFLRSQNVHNDGLRLDDVALIAPAVHENMSGTHIQPNDVLLNITGASIGRCALVPDTFKVGNVSQHVAIIRLVLPVIREFMHLALISPTYQQMIDDVQVGVSREGLSMQRLRLFPMPLPPLAEQHRIIAKVDELMALCDGLEAAQSKREQLRDRLAASSLHRLNHPAPDTRPTDFHSHVRFHLNNLSRLTTRPGQITALRQSILLLAVNGRLVAQDPNDEPASNLIKKINAEKERLVKGKSSSRLPPLSPLSGLTTLPKGWEWVSLGGLLREGSQNGYSRKPDDDPDGIPILRISAGTVRKDGIVAEEEHKLIGHVTAKDQSQYALHPGDLLACRFNGNRSYVGRLTLYTGYLGINPIYPDKLIRLRVAANYVLPKLVRCFAESALIRQQVENFCATTVGNWGISASNLRNVVIPLPPHAEQHRIVAKVDELMALCDRLESQLTTAQSTSHRLLESILHEALGC